MNGFDMGDDLWTECAACSTRSDYAGWAERHGDRLFGLFHCPQCRVDFTMWRPGFDRRLAPDAINPAQRLDDLARRLCRTANGDGDAMRDAVAASSIALLHPQAIEITPGARAAVDLISIERPPMVQHLEDWFGPGEDLPRTGAGATHVRAWRRAEPGAPGRTSIFARFHTAPWAFGRPHGILLRIDPSE